MKLVWTEVLLMILALSAALAAWAGEAALSLSEAVRYAAENAPGLAIERTTEEIRVLEERNSRYKLLPNLDLTTTNGLRGTSSDRGASPTQPWSSLLMLSLIEYLYDNGESLTRIRIASLKSERARLSVLKTREELSLQVAQEFYLYSLSNELIEVKRQQKISIEKQYASLSQEYLQGFKTKQDYLRLKARLQRSVLDVLAAESKRDQAEIQLNKILGVQSEDGKKLKFIPLRASDMLKKIPETLPVLENTYLYRIQQLDAQIDDKTVDLSRRKIWPEASLSSGVTYQFQDYLNAPTGYASSSTNWNVLLTLTYKIWDWGNLRRDASIAQSKALNEAHDRKKNWFEQRAKIEVLGEEMQRLSSSFSLQKELLAMEDETYTRLSANYREGKIPYLDLITGMDNLLDARVNYYTIYFNLLSKFAEYQSYEGKLYETLAHQ